MNKYTIFHEEPRVSFGSFTFAWEQRKLGDVFEEYSEKNHPELPALTIIQGQGTIRRDESDRQLTYDKSSLDNYKLVREGDFIVHLRSFEGGLEVAKSDGIISPAYHTLHSDIANSDFYYPYFRSHDFINVKLINCVYGIRDGRSIDVAEMKKIKIPYTSLKEQNKISACFVKLNHLITLHQRKSEFLCSVNHTKINKNNAYFTNDWEQRKLGVVVDVQSGKDYKHLSEGNIPVYGTGGYMLSVNKALSYKQDAIGIGRKGTIDKPYVLKAPFWTVDTLFYAIPKDNNDLEFLNCIFQNVDWKKKDESTGVPSLSKSTINNVDFSTPNESEQQSIGEYFSKLDHLITLHQREYEKLQNIKKSMLEKMFV